MDEIPQAQGDPVWVVNDSNYRDVVAQGRQVDTAWPGS
jgi:hypothetical protein